ncbi:NAD(P)H-binding protein [Nakamurella sp. A5-74]|uniref:NAD(P)H-binding protein n=1 Tax=Nakamurella sp. A5-74 TaxID=3158264 RepID=A0AAU8DMM9_9ACTN
MRIVVFGATGGTGSQVVRQAVAAGHEVTAVIRRSGALAAQQRLQVVVGALDEMDVVENAVRGQDVVISALGTDRKGPTTVCTDAIGVILTAMRTQHLGRLLVVSAYGAADTHDRSLYSRLLWAMKGDSMRDKESMEALVRESEVDWTIVRPPALTNGPSTGAYRTGTDLPIGLRSRISRADLAGFLLRESAAPAFTKLAPRITR